MTLYKYFLILNSFRQSASQDRPPSPCGSTCTCWLRTLRAREWSPAGAATLAAGEWAPRIGPSTQRPRRMRALGRGPPLSVRACAAGRGRRTRRRCALLLLLRGGRAVHWHARWHGMPAIALALFMSRRGPATAAAGPSMRGILPCVALCCHVFRRSLPVLLLLWVGQSVYRSAVTASDRGERQPGTPIAVVCTEATRQANRGKRRDHRDDPAEASRCERTPTRGGAQSDRVARNGRTQTAV